MIIGSLALLLSAAHADVERFALVIGANHGLAEEESLRYAERDAERMARTLQQVGDVAAHRVVVLRSTEADEVSRALDEMASRVAGVEDGDDTLLLVYYSGHASREALHLNGTRLPLRELRDRIEAVPADVSVLMVDACQSGALTRKGAAPAEPFALDEAPLDSEGLAILTSSSVGEDAQESELFRGGVFTHHLVNGLLGAADTSRDGRITLEETYDYAYAHTLETTSWTEIVQHPSFSFELRGTSNLVLSRLDNPRGAGSVTFEEAGSYLLFEESTAELSAEVTVAAGARIFVAPGRYRVRRREEGQVLEGSVHVTLGEATVVDPADLEARAYGETVRKGLARRRAATMLSAGAGIVPPLTGGATVGPATHLGLRVDLAPISMGARVHYTWQGWSNEELQSNLHRVSVDLYLSKMFDVGLVSPGFGVRGGLDVYRQIFDKPGLADTALGGRVGPVAGLEVKLHPRVVLGLWGGADMVIAPTWEPETDSRQLRLSASPNALLELGFYVD